MRQFRTFSAGLAILAFAAACSDTPRSATGPGSSPPRRAALEAPEPGTCTTLEALIELANAAFGSGSPNANSVIGKLNNLQHHIDNGDFEAAKERAFDIVEFVLDKHAEGGLPGGDDAVAALVNSTFCFAGLAHGND
jgi:hypothetical protein